MLKQGTDPNSKERKFLVVATNEQLIASTFSATLYQIQNVSFLPEEEEALGNCGAEIASGELDEDDAVINILKYRIPLVAYVQWDKKITWSN